MPPVGSRTCAVPQRFQTDHSPSPFKPPVWQFGGELGNHLLCAVPNRLIYEADISAINPWRDRLASNPLVVKDGFIEPNDEPGSASPLMRRSWPTIPRLQVHPTCRRVNAQKPYLAAEDAFHGAHPSAGACESGSCP